MTVETARLTDSMTSASGYGRPQNCLFRVNGWGFAELFDRHMELIQRVEFENLVTQNGDQFYGDRAANIKAASVPVTAITNAVTATVTTTGSHGFGIGDPVLLAGVTPTGYNGNWVVTTVPSATTFTIYVGTALGALTVAGTAVGLTKPAVSGMRLGTGSTAVAKTGAGSFIGTYTTASQQALDATYPQSALSVSSRRITYKVTWIAGTATASGLNEVALTHETPLSNVAGVAIDTISRALLSPVVNKGASDTLAVTWNHDLLGA